MEIPMSQMTIKENVMQEYGAIQQGQQTEKSVTPAMQSPSVSAFRSAVSPDAAPLEREPTAGQTHFAPEPPVQIDVIQMANHLYGKTPDWVTFFREVLGVDGVVRKVYDTAEKIALFEQSEEYQQIQQMLAKLRERKTPSTDEQTRVITVRMPISLHSSLRAESHEKHTSMNKLCISKLLQMVDPDLVPSD